MTRKKTLTEGIGCLGIILSIPLLVVVGSVANGYVLTKFWEWFAIPTFAGLPVLKVVPAIGLAMMVRLAVIISEKSPTQTKEAEKKTLPLWAVAVLRVVYADRIMKGKKGDLPSWVMEDIEDPLEPGVKKERKVLWFWGFSKVVAAVVSTPFIMLFFGWITSLFM